MKVFISWSGTRSKQIALILRDWLPTVIQALEPFVSSEDIEKGARWNTEIAQELNESTFGIICVTKDNLSAPWLNFEAGALSKTIDNSYVAPLLFDVKPSELKGSPISQFQSTSFTIEDMKRLIETLNTAAGNCLNTSRLNKAFELCYPDLEKTIKELREKPCEKDEETEQTPNSLDSNILEELLETARNTQRLLGNTDSKLYGNLDDVNKKVDEIIDRLERQRDIDIRRATRKIRPMLIEELSFDSYDSEIFPYNVLMVLSIFKDDIPWLYDAGAELVRTLESNTARKTKSEAVKKFINVLEYTCGHPIFREILGTRKDLMRLRELPMFLERTLERYIEN
ncbi:MAG: toll/interleukin-1 receptor domain-containing protein [Clostridia bacterium]|nr:toll/interleukin-1 receptor domain-containing protein [Clostridia bacterium]